MQLTFPSDKSVELSFKLGIAGTQAAPSSVAIVLSKGDKKLSFVAAKVNDEWLVTISNPAAVFGLGEIAVAVQVILNNQIFSPLKTSGNIIAQDVAESIVEVQPAAVTAPVTETVVEEKVEEKVEELTVVEAAPMPAPTTSLFKAVDEAVNAKPVIVEKQKAKKKLSIFESSKTSELFSVRKTKVILK